MRKKLAEASTVLGIVLVSSQLPVAPLVFWRELELSCHSVIRQCPLGVMSLPLTIVRRIVGVTHPNRWQSGARQIVVFWILLRPAIAQIPGTNYMSYTNCMKSNTGGTQPAGQLISSTLNTLMKMYTMSQKADYFYFYVNFGNVDQFS